MAQWTLRLWLSRTGYTGSLGSHLHLGGDHASHGPQPVVPHRVDACRLLGRPVVEPDDDVALVLGGGTRIDADWGAGGVKANERTSGVEPEAAHLAGVDASCRERAAHAFTNGGPDILGEWG